MARYELAELLPLKGAALLLTDVAEADASRAVCHGRVPRQSPFARETVPVHAALEIAAQAAGAHGSIVQRMRGTFLLPRAGYLVIVRNARFARPHFTVDSELTIEVTADGDAGELALYTFEVRDEDGTIAEGSLGTFVDRPGQEPRAES